MRLRRLHSRGAGYRLQISGADREDDHVASVPNALPRGFFVTLPRPVLVAKLRIVYRQPQGDSRVLIPETSGSRRQAAETGDRREFQTDLLEADTFVSLPPVRRELRQQGGKRPKALSMDVGARLIGFYQPQVVAQPSLDGGTQRQLDTSTGVPACHASRVGILPLGSLGVWSRCALGRANRTRSRDRVIERSQGLLNAGRAQRKGTAQVSDLKQLRCSLGHDQPPCECPTIGNAALPTWVTA